MIKTWIFDLEGLESEFFLQPPWTQLAPMWWDLLFIYISDLIYGQN